MEERLRAYLSGVYEALQGLDLLAVERMVEVLHQARLLGATVFILGNGGSAATASHFACDLSKGTLVQGGPRFRALALTDNLPLITAWSNDVDYADVFVEQLKSLLRPGDVVIGISGSGNSENVVRALRWAKERMARTIAMVGFDGGRLRSVADLVVWVPCSVMEQVEDVHLILEHMITVMLRQCAREQVVLAAEHVEDSVPFE